jgi:hypothetical protein
MYVVELLEARTSWELISGWVVVVGRRRCSWRSHLLLVVFFIITVA